MILDKKHEMQRKLFRQFAETEFTKEIQDELDETGEFNWDMHKKMARYGFMGVKIPKEYGGAGADSLTYALMVEELARVDAVLSIYANTSNSLGGGPLLLGGNEAQKQKYLPAVASGEKIMVFGLTEPGAGSDAGGTTTTAIADGDDFIINGRKCFISGAPMADWAVVFAKTDLTAKGSKGISMFVVDMKLPGVSLGAHEKKMGINGYPTCDLVLEDVRVSKDCLVGPLHKGFQIAMKIKLPNVRAAALLAMLLSIVGTIQLFNEPQVMSISDPSISKSYTPMMMALNTSQGTLTPGGDGPASAVAIVMALIAGVLAVVYTLIERKVNAE